MRQIGRWRTIKNQFKQFLLPFIIFLLFWIAGFITFYVIERDSKSFFDIFLISIAIRASEGSPTFYNFYQFLWPLLFELLILTFILTTLQELYGYNPLYKARKAASHKRNHTVVLGYNHLGERIVEYLREHKKPYSIVEIEQDKIEDLINFDQPVVVGDYTDKDVMSLAGVHKCKEVICVTTDLRRALIAAEKVREINKTCDLYMRVFNDHFRDFLKGEPWNAFTFSISKWTMESVKEWSDDIKEKDEIVVLGNDTIVMRIVEFYGRDLKCKVYLIDPEIDPEIYNDLPNVLAYQEKIQFLANLEERCDMNTLKQLYLCWNTEELFSDAILLTVAIKKRYPNIDLFVRMFDEELAQIAKTIEATTFSTSAYAFQMLQQEVKPSSGIYPRP
ncbi:MAG: hypothetical protein FK733_07065 [Asgard group archaeon]|nr:hypothetical protein [Asgard group archaeon]